MRLAWARRWLPTSDHHSLMANSSAPTVPTAPAEAATAVVTSVAVEPVVTVMGDCMGGTVGLSPTATA